MSNIPLSNQNFRNLTESLSLKIKLARKKSRRKIEPISRILKIRPEYLNYIEENKFHMIPGNIYLKSFIKNYATFLKVDISSEMLELKKYLNSPKNELSNIIEKQLKTPRPKVRLLVIISVILLGLIFFVGKLKNSVLLYSTLNNFILLI
ncbi:MAG: hypothetical protein CMM96_06345 [Rickettsiales bacterium]|nr:hypothetical protein [Rickettsiales bacterium]|tara:strand:+ start:34 stop:483 length:450 start_codon:yes stop_codon:yes gene_type:complete